jgi:hypothetical protein
VLDSLVRRIDSGEIGGPHVIRSGFIEAKSPFNSNNGIVVDSQEKALDAVRWYGARGFWQIKIYNSMNPAWVPAMVEEAHRLGMRVAGHVPAFASADQMIEAGYDEITHINQFVLGWVIAQGEDTRTLFRLTALKRLPALDLSSAKVQHTLDLMEKGKKVIDPTLAIHENLAFNRDGQVPPGATDYLAHMPIGTRRDAMKAWTDTSAPGDDLAYRQAFEKLVDVVRQLHKRGVFIVFGTDTGGSFSYHRELELYQSAGMTAPEILKRATWDSARYVGQEQSAGSIEKGKRADFFLVPGDPTKDLKAIKTIAMVVKDGVFYYPSEAYPKFGIEPFTAVPKVTLPAVEAPPVKSEAPAMTNDLQSIVAAAKQDAVARGVPSQSITVQSAQRVTWRDGSLGCPAPDMQYTMALVPGWRVILRVGDATYDYHAAASGHLILCPRERASEPIADQSA